MTQRDFDKLVMIHLGWRIVGGLRGRRYYADPSFGLRSTASARKACNEKIQQLYSERQAA